MNRAKSKVQYHLLYPPVNIDLFLPNGSVLLPRIFPVNASDLNGDPMMVRTLTFAVEHPYRSICRLVHSRRSSPSRKISPASKAK